MARIRRPPERSAGPLEHPEHRGRPGLGGVARGQESEPVPWRWFGLGIAVTLVSIVIAGTVVYAALARRPLTTTVPTPTIIRLTAPATPAWTPTPPPPTPTEIPTLTLPATPDTSVAPEVLTVGYYAQVSNTEGIGVSLRSGPSTDNLRLTLVAEGTVLLVTGGPEEGSGFIWWQVQLDDESDGWIAGDFLIPAGRP